MSDQARHVRHGFGTVRPYLYGPLGLEEFVTRVFGAVELERHPVGPDAFHIESRIGDSVVVLETGETIPTGATRASIYVYVRDVDAAYRRALEGGATAVAEPQDKPYGERVGGVKDPFGNVWWMSTPTRTAL